MTETKIDATIHAGRARSGLAVLTVVWLAAAVWGWTWLDRGWVPHDEGALAQSAERVLEGQVPHADFDEIYTGALSYVHAAAFRVFGVRLVSMRYVLFGAWLLWIPAVWGVARRFAPPLPAGLFTALAAALSIPNYAASLPSWYQLFLATAALAAALRYLETRARRWLTLAGVAAGVSILMKVVGVYLVLALVVWLVFVEQEERGRTAGAGRAASGVLTLGLVALAAGLVALVRGFGGVSQYVQFALPGAALAGFLVVREWRRPVGPDARRLASRVAALAVGVAIPLVLFLALYADGDSLRALFEGVLVAPRRRFSFASMHPPRIGTAVWVALPALLIVGATRGGLRERRRTVALAAALGAVVLAASGEGFVYRAVWYALRWSIPAVTVAGIGVLALRGRDGRDPGPGATADRAGGPTGRSAAFAAVSVVAFTGLVQFPFSAPVYFLYVAPLAALALLAVAGPVERARPVLAVTAGFLILFVALRVTPGFIYVMGFAPDENRYTERLDLDRARLRVTEEDRATYEALLGVLRERPLAGPMWAGPDAPEVYFLSGRSNPTRGVFDFLSGSRRSPGPFVEALERRGVRVVVVNRGPSFSPPLGPDVERAIEERWPRGSTAGRFVVRWKP